MSHCVRLVLALHNHQPVGNFDGVFEAAYQDSYAPFLGVLEQRPEVPVSLHTSGCLLEWTAEHHPEYVDRLRLLVERGQVEIVGGGFYEPILPMIPARDRVGQIAGYSRYLQKMFGVPVRGMWIPERVWEPGLVEDIVIAGIEYTVLDDYHFTSAGLTDRELTGYFITEDEGLLLKVFPGCERLRYTIPFADPHETVDYLRQFAADHPGAVVVFADDGEKFGTWPGTKKHCYEDGWLARFLDAITREHDWLKLCTFSEAVQETPPVGKIYLPNCSYREMTEWALPVARLMEYEQLVRDLEHDPRFPALKGFLRGGFWRNFKVKYPETDEMYARMLQVSRGLEDPSVVAGAAKEAVRANGDPAETRLTLDDARRALYRAQCNCAYWHGAFGGLYLPHLRQAVYRNLIEADSALVRAAGRRSAWASVDAADYNLDLRQEVRLANDRLVAFIAPARGGQVRELDVRAAGVNLLATVARRPETYHQKVLDAVADPSKQRSITSIHQQASFQHADLDRRLVYDRWPRKSAMDHIYAPDVSLDDLIAGHADERGDFLHGVYETRVRRPSGKVQAVLTRTGRAGDAQVKLTKTFSLEAGSSALEVRYLFEGLPPGDAFLLAVEWNFAGLAAGAADRYFYDEHGNALGQLESVLELEDAARIGLLDQWLGLDAALGWSRRAGLWTYPIQTVSQSEAGYELVFQSTAVVPHWLVRPDRRGRWDVQFVLALDTSRAEERRRQSSGTQVAY